VCDYGSSFVGLFTVTVTVFYGDGFLLVIASHSFQYRLFNLNQWHKSFKTDFVINV
jgi:hypothetical protein